MKKVIIWAIVIVALFGGNIWWSKSMQSKDPDIISRNGLHWHPILSIYVKGEKQIIPEGIGIGAQYSSWPMGMAPIHTHSDAGEGIIHLEFTGPVRPSDITLNEFLKNWGKNIDSFGSEVKMLVNGIENNEFENYVMHDGDKIELLYE